MENTTVPNNLTYESVLALIKEVAENIRETDKKLTLRFQETDKQIQETDKKLTRQFQETDKQIQETDKKLTQRFQETDKAISRLANLFTTQWGKLVEALVEPACLHLFQERGIAIEQSMTNVIAKHKGRDAIECDILLVNDNELVVVEVKTTFRPEVVREFTEKLKRFKTYFPQYKNYAVYGATAALRYEGESDKYAYRSGMFVLKSSGEVISIANDSKFQPTAY